MHCGIIDNSNKSSLNGYVVMGNVNVKINYGWVNIIYCTFNIHLFIETST